ncbi:hypothetical protein ABE073_04915 [Lederbergia citrisecunda]|uniref:hypothetical protein n=1 Tax=Lederbergia citrisecunda TaxID=2833583 RepID=UPI003D27E170
MSDKSREKILGYLIMLRDWDNIRGIRQDYMSGKLNPLDELKEVDEFLKANNICKCVYEGF